MSRFLVAPNSVNLPGRYGRVSPIRGLTEGADHCGRTKSDGVKVH